VFLEGGQPRGVGGGWRLLGGILVDCILSKEMKLSRRFRLRRYRKGDSTFGIGVIPESFSDCQTDSDETPAKGSVIML
jgi:hypothetical protein